MMMPRIRAATLLAAAALCATGAQLAAQRLPAGPDPAAEAAERAVALYNAPATTRLAGFFHLPATATILGDLAVAEGAVTLAGRVAGRVVVVNGDLRLLPGAEVEGDVLVVGGTITGAATARIGGTARAFPAPVRYRRDGDLLVLLPPPHPRTVMAGRELPFGRLDLGVSTRTGYNRVEGLPIAFGPRITSAGRYPTRLEALLIYRSVSGLSLETGEIGYSLSAEQRVGERPNVHLGVTAFSEIIPIEDSGLANRENALSTFLLHRDYRDHYEREGWAVSLRAARPGRPLEAALVYRSERHGTVEPGAPWALTGNDQPWRPQPLIAEGRLRSLQLGTAYDTRNVALDPSTGWWVRTRLEQALGGTFALPAPEQEAAAVPFPIDRHFTAFSLDARRYARLGPGARLGVRAFLAGSLDGGALPPQRQRALGGEGSIPGWGLFNFDCGARDRTVTGQRTEFFPYYGCDRVVLAQLEYHGRFPVVRTLPRHFGLDVDLGETPGWVFFFDAGRAWTEDAVAGERGRGQDDFAVDAGLGLRIGRLGTYVAVPVSGRAREINFFVRLDSRL
jgi:hypothetical protein